VRDSDPRRSGCWKSGSISVSQVTGQSSLHVTNATRAGVDVSTQVFALENTELTLMFRYVQKHKSYMFCFW